MKRSILTVAAILACGTAGYAQESEIKEIEIKESPQGVEIKETEVETMGGEEQLPPCPPEAAPQAEVTPPPEPAVAPPPEEKKRWRVFDPRQVGLATGAGPTDYFGTAINTFTTGTNVGGAWDVRATVGQRSILALEAG